MSLALSAAASRDPNSGVWVAARASRLRFVRNFNSVAEPRCLSKQRVRGPVEPRRYTSFDYTQVLDDRRVLQSIGSVGDAYDNAMAESFVGSFKTELIADRVWRTRSQLELAVVEYIAWFNTTRLHSALGDLPPAEYEALCAPMFETLAGT